MQQAGGVRKASAILIQGPRRRAILVLFGLNVNGYAPSRGQDRKRDDAMGRRRARLGRISDLDLRLLRVFQAVAECRGLAAAELRLGITRSTISTYLADLETRMGVRLCERGRGGFELTEDGQRVLSGRRGPDAVAQ